MLNRIINQVITIIVKPKGEIITMWINNMIDVVRIMIIDIIELDINIEECDYEYEDVLNEIRYREN